MRIDSDKATTIIGAVMAGLMAAKPILDGSGYHWNTKTVTEVVFAFLIAAGGFLVNRTGKNGKA